MQTQSSQSTIAQVVKKHAIRMVCEPATHNPNMDRSDKWHNEAHHWKVTFKKKDRQFTLYFSMGKLRYEEPKADEVIDCLRMDFISIRSEPTFESWASSLGYDEDSRKAYKSWLICKRQAAKFERFMGKEAIEDLENCEGL